MSRARCGGLLVAAMLRCGHAPGLKQGSGASGVALRLLEIKELKSNSGELEEQTARRRVEEAKGNNK